MNNNMLRALAVLCCVSLGTLQIHAQAASEIYYFQLKDTAVSKLRRLTNALPDRYNNQPCFVGDSVLFISMLDGQTDVFSYQPDVEVLRRLTHSPEAEFSPNMLPSQRHFSVMRINAKNQQQLWQVSWGAAAESFKILASVSDIAYYTWLNAQQVAVVRLGTPNRLEVVHVVSEKTIEVAQEVGRSLQLTPRGDLSFTGLDAQGRLYIMLWNAAQAKVSKLIMLPAHTQDYFWANDGGIWIGQGPQLLRFRPGIDRNWKVVVNLADYGVKRISRLAVHKDNKTFVVVDTP